MAEQSAEHIIEETTVVAESFEQLVREHQAMVFSMAFACLRDRALAEDIAQDVFLELHRGWRSLQSPEHVRHWLRRVTAHRLVDRARQQKRRPQAPLADIPEPSAPVTDRDPLLAEALRQLIATLPEKARLVMILRFQEDLDPTDIGRVLDMPLGTVKSHLQRSLAFLREKLSRRYGVIQL